MQQVLIIDNYDSFTYNLAHYLEALDCKVTVVRNDRFKRSQIDNFQKIIISPGPGLPKESGNIIDFLINYKTTKSILGICLGQQAIAEVFQGKLSQLKHVSHGEEAMITHLDNDFIYQNVPPLFQVGLYHSWETVNIANNLIPTALSKDGTVMSFKHIEHDIRAVQYHPESIMTPFGKTILKNWLNN